MANDKMREEFEDWATDNDQYGISRTHSDLRYDETDTEAAWSAWQASRESLVIDLDRCAAEVYDGSGNLDFTATVNAIEATGVKVKP